VHGLSGCLQLCQAQPDVVFGVVPYAKPANIKRARVIIMVPLNSRISANLAGLFCNLSIQDRNTRQMLRPSFVRVSLCPPVFRSLIANDFAGGSAGALFYALTLTLLGNPRRVLHLLLVVQASVNLGAFFALVEGALAAIRMSIEL
jgi:hypothetical protein